MRRNKCRGCKLNSRDLEDFCDDLSEFLKEQSRAAFVLSVYAQSFGSKRSARQLQNIAMLLGKCSAISSVLENDLYDSKRPQNQLK